MKYALITLLLGFFAAGCQDNVQYEADWHSENHRLINDVIAKHQVPNCGMYRYKNSTNISTEYLLRCSKLGSTWLEYTLSIGTGDISTARFPSTKYN